MRRSYLIAGTIALLAAGWLGSGMLFKSDTGRSAPAVSAEAAQLQEPKPDNDIDVAAGAAPVDVPSGPPLTRPGELVSVQVATSKAEPQPRTIVLRGRTEADRVVEVRAETTGRVVEIPVDEGALVHKGDLIAVLDGADRAARLAEAKALLQQRQAESEASRRLAEKGFAPKLNLAELAANLALAQAQVKSMEVEISHLSIKAPIEGVLDDRNAEVGHYLQIADPVATIIDLDPIVIVGYATERDVSQLEIGGPARARLLDGREVVGALRFIAARAETQTRTFRIEVEVPNADYEIRDGLSAELVVPVEDVPAHRISPAVLTLGPSGEVGVKLVDEADTVRFAPVQILREDSRGLWITGLAPTARMIVVGQDFVIDDQLVRPVETKSGAAETTTQ
ncbi:efflux RND transporter periplasmic adaptor subunit [Dongia deserti]|uniref:efflux RND transporter periplasmic adaptor subunit n=1 Tax=Dongia deserti TaxID=2268030 RepID=UPI000E64B562|nr:efflux RND transporter periplasmic adaptor subunit [Dongia deserti]